MLRGTDSPKNVTNSKGRPKRGRLTSLSLMQHECSGTQWVRAPPPEEKRQTGKAKNESRTDERKPEQKSPRRTGSLPTEADKTAFLRQKRKKRKPKNESRTNERKPEQKSPRRTGSLPTEADKTAFLRQKRKKRKPKHNQITFRSSGSSLRYEQHRPVQPAITSQPGT